MTAETTVWKIFTAEQWAEQAKQNSDEISHFMHQLGDAMKSAHNDDRHEDDQQEDRNVD